MGVVLKRSKKVTPTSITMTDFQISPTEKLDRIVTEIRTLSEKFYLEIGAKLLQAKDLLPHGQFQIWLKDNFGWSFSTAQRLMTAADLVSKHPATAVLPQTALYALAAPNVPDAVKAGVTAEIEAGNIPTAKAIKAKLALLTPEPEIAKSVTMTDLQAKSDKLIADLVARMKAVGLDATVAAMDLAFPDFDVEYNPE